MKKRAAAGKGIGCPPAVPLAAMLGNTHWLMYCMYDLDVAESKVLAYKVCNGLLYCS